MIIGPLVKRYREKLAVILECPVKQIVFKVRLGEAVHRIPDDHCLNDTSKFALGWTLGRFVVEFNNLDLAAFELSELPHCCGVVVSSGVYVAETYRHRGIGTLLHQLQIALATGMGYTTMLCTDVQDNEPERKILAKVGWKDVYTFRNWRSGNVVNISCLDLFGTQCFEK